MSAMMAKAARAVAEIIGQWEASDKLCSEVSPRIVRAVLEAIKTPTNAMIDAGMKLEEIDLASEYTAMLSAILKEEA